MKKNLLLLLLCLAVPLALAGPLPSTTRQTRNNPGAIITSAQWNAAIPGICNYINTYVVTPLNKLTTKGDVYGFDGTNIQRVAAGTNGHALTVDSTLESGIGYQSPLAQQPMTTKGDTLYGTGKTIARLPVGGDGNALGLVDGLPAWIDLSTSSNLPRGAIVPYSFSFAGSATVPAGFAVCDGTNSTPNLIGLFVIGTKPPGSSSSAVSGGYGAQGADGRGTGTATHTHAASYPTGLIGVNPFNLEYDGASNVTPYGVYGTDATVAAPYHTHNQSGGAFGVTSVSNEPSDYALVYLVKL